MKSRPLSVGEETMALHLKAEGIPFTREFKFHPERKWRFDFALDLPHHIAIECEGGTWIDGGHSRGAAFERDCEKYAEAIILGWQVFRFTTGMIKRGEAISYIKRAIA